MITSADPTDPTYGASILFIQQVTGASFSTARRWKLNPAKMPTSDAKLVRFAVFGDLTEVLGDAWRGFEFRGGMLYPPYFRGGFSPLQIAAMFFERQELLEYRRRDRARNHTREIYYRELAKQEKSPEGLLLNRKLSAIQSRVRSL